MNITAQEAKEIMDTQESNEILDTRTEEEFAEGHIPGAILIPYDEILEKAESVLKEKDQLIFDAFGIEHQIDKVLKKRVWLPCGGYLVIDPCEAMTVIDVNSGSFIGVSSLEETVFNVNLRAAKEIARQVRLRGIGGIIIIMILSL